VALVDVKHPSSCECVETALGKISLDVLCCIIIDWTDRTADRLSGGM
jgi:hypothetical protein